jgi:hypothetical protein
MRNSSFVSNKFGHYDYGWVGGQTRSQDLEENEVSGSLEKVSLSMFTQALQLQLLYLSIIILYCCYDFHRTSRCSDGYFNLVYQTHSFEL